MKPSGYTFGSGFCCISEAVGVAATPPMAPQPVQAEDDSSSATD